MGWQFKISIGTMLQDAQRESALAQIYLEQYISLEEMDGPYESFEQIKKNILQLN